MNAPPARDAGTVAASGNTLEDDAVPAGRTPRYPSIARACFHLDCLFLFVWGLYAAGPDLLGLLPWGREDAAYALFSGGFFVLHFAVIATGIIALFVVIIEVHGGRTVRGFRSVIAALVLPIVSFLHFAARYLLEVVRWLEP